MTTPRDALRSILPVAGWSREVSDEVDFTGTGDPMMRTPYEVGTAGAATIAASGLAAAHLWEVRGGEKQRVGVDLRHAGAAMRSGHYMKLGDGALSAARNGIMGFYPTKDGRWSYLHCNFPNHRAVALKVVGVPTEDRAAVAKAVTNWTAADLEEAIIAHKGAGGMVRTADEWKRHPQGIAVAGLPLMEIVKIGDSAPEPLPAGDRPLSGIRVVDITRVLAGPTCA
ncbi:MAG: CoA transferase, partial [Proteobacteria bacterium]|nr:CoA transferase [Pseudomonadota bacterium]